ncbi:MAG: MATE family efflux transporter [Clostridia bacterium]|nr:MATE family efflux transporter [Clostridia bacterium]
MQKNPAKTLSHDEKMGTMPIRPLLISTALPMMLSMLVQALYNVVDSLYVSRLASSEEALNAVSLSFPLQTLMIGIGIGTAVGTNAMLSRYLGAKMPYEAERSANTGLFLSIITSLVFAVIGFTFSNFYFRSINGPAMNNALAIADELERETEVARINKIISYGTSYCTICLSLSMGFFLQATFERMLTATGRSRIAMLCQMSGAVTNILLDPVFIFGADWLGIPSLEVAGAAVATVIGQFVAGIMAILFVSFQVKEVRIHIKKLRWHTQTVKEIYRIGLPSIIMQCVGSAMNYLMNLILIGFTTAATAFFGVYYKLQSFIFMPVFGLNNGMVPIISYNYGARQKQRVWATVRLSVYISVAIMSAGMIVFETMPGTLLKLFNAGEEMMKLGTRGLRIIAVHFPVAGFCIIMGSVFQAVGNPAHSMIISVCRQLLALLPAAWLLGRLFGLDALWFSFLIAEAVSLTLSVIFMKKTRVLIDQTLG